MFQKELVFPDIMCLMNYQSSVLFIVIVEGYGL